MNATAIPTACTCGDDLALCPSCRPLPEARGLYRAGEVRVLVLDDPPVCDLMYAALAPHGFQVVTSSDPSEMETVLRGDPYHVVILDYVTPGLEPGKTLDWLFEFQPAAGVIVATAYPSVDSAVQCLRARVFDYLAKPVHVAQLHESVMRCLESKGLLRVSEDAIKKLLGAAIRERRKALGLTLARAAQRSGVSLGFLSQIEMGRNCGSVGSLYRISAGLGMRMSELFQAVQS